MNSILLGWLALTSSARAEEVEVLVAPFQAVGLESKGISALLHAYMEVFLDEQSELDVLPVAEAGHVFDQKATLYLDSCPPTDEVGCALIVADAAGLPFAVTGSVQATESGADVHVYVLDVRELRQVDFTWALQGDDGALAEETARRLLAVARGEEGVPVDERFRRPAKSEEELAEEEARRQDAAELQRSRSEVRDLGQRQKVELERQRVTEAELAERMEGEGSKPWEQLEMSPRQYMRYKNSGLQLYEWRARARGRQSQVLLRPALGLVRGPVAGAYYGRYVRSETTLQVVQSYGWQAMTMGSGASLGLQAGYGLLPGLELGLVGGAALGGYTADIDVVDEGSVVRARDPMTFSSWNLHGGLQVLAAPLPTLTVRPVIGGQLLLWRGAAVDRFVLPPEDSGLEVFPAPTLGLVGVVAGVEARLGPRIDGWAHVPVQAVIWGGDANVQDEGISYLDPKEEPPTLAPVGAGLLLGLQVRLLGPRPEKQGLDAYDDL